MIRLDAPVPAAANESRWHAKAPRTRASASKIAGAIDKDARRAVVGRRLGESSLGRLVVGDVAVDGDAVDLDRGLRSRFLIDVEQSHLGSGLSQHARGGGAEARASAGNECCVSANIHDQLPCAAAILEGPATMTFAGGGSA